MKKHERLPFEVIVSATEGDPEAIATVMNFYDGYISKLCLRKLYDEHGNVCMVVAICAEQRPLVRLPAATRRSTTATFIKGFR